MLLDATPEVDRRERLGRPEQEEVAAGIATVTEFQIGPLGLRRGRAHHGLRRQQHGDVGAGGRRVDELPHPFGLQQGVVHCGHE